MLCITTYTKILFFYSMFIFLGGSLLRNILSTINSMRAVRTRARRKLCIGLCVGGQTINQLLRRLRGHEQRVTGKWAVVLMGTNECLQKRIRSKRKIRQEGIVLSQNTNCILHQYSVVLCTLPQLYNNDSLAMDLMPVYNHLIRIGRFACQVGWFMGRYFWWHVHYCTCRSRNVSFIYIFFVIY